MKEVVLLPLASWQNFYGIVGTAAATLTGLLFVVVALIAQLRIPTAAPTSGTAVFSTPNVVHFGAALLVAAMLSAPWQVLWPAALLLGLEGLGGVAYLLRVYWLARYRLENYQPVLEDWLWHTILPFVSYIAFVVAALLLVSYPAPTLFAVAAAVLLLLFIGIHNAWDVVTYMVFEAPRARPTSQDKPDE